MDPGGVETLLMNVYRHIDRNRVQFDFAVHSTEGSYYDSEIRSLGGRVFPLPEPAALPQYVWRLRRLLHRQGPFAAVHSHVYSFSGLALHVARRGGIPLRIAHSHTTSDGKPDRSGRAAYRRLMHMLILRNATHLFACSQPAATALYGHHSLADPRATILPNAIDLSPYRSLPTDKEMLRQELTLPAGNPLLGHIGSFRRPKNHAFLIELMALLVAREPCAQLLLVGDGPLRGEVEQLAYEKGIRDHVHFLGLRSDVPRILGSLDLFLFPSLHEGLGIVLIEAQAAGIPCLVSHAVPSAANLSLGLVRTASLKQGPGEWLDLVAGQLALSPVPWPEREAALRRAGYDIEELARRLLGVYENG
jgi:glycosyltransferase involved in cell wall biosynthesis